MIDCFTSANIPTNNDLCQEKYLAKKNNKISYMKSVPKKEQDTMSNTVIWNILHIIPVQSHYHRIIIIFVSIS